MNSSRYFSICLLLSLFLIHLDQTHVYAQESGADQKSDFWKNVRFGGGLGLSFGDGFFSGGITPTGIYQFDEQFAAGVGLNASYNSQKDVYDSTILGGSVLGLFNPIPEIQLSTEFEQLHVSRNFEQDYAGNLDDNYWSPALFVGAGYSAQNVTIGIRYDLLYSSTNSVYAQSWVPFVRVFF